MTAAVIAWAVMVIAIMWIICGVSSLVAGGELWPFGKRGGGK